MKRVKTFILYGLIAVIAGIVACNKETVQQTDRLQAVDNNAAQALSPCDQFAYPDSIFYQSPAQATNVIKPLVALAGKYGAFPTGLSINVLNGNINISKSETGLEYLVWLIPQGTTDTCFKKIIVSGINYDDSIYVTGNNASSLGKPIYNANTSTPVDCKSGCEFDDGPDDDNGNGIADEPPAGQEVIPQGISINKKTGVINWKKSIQNGALGKNPVSGANKEFIVNYRLGDKSSKALNRIGFHLFYYKTQAEIPAKLLDDIKAKQGQVILEDEDDGGHHGGGGGHHGGGNNISLAVAVSLSADASKGKKDGGEVKCRPPYIIVTDK